MEETEEALMRAYRAGDRAAFRRLFERIAPTLAGTLRRPPLTEQDAQDLVQQTFLQVHRARRDFREGARVRPWVFTIAYNLRRDLLRFRSRRPRSAHDGVDEIASWAEMPDMGVDQTGVRRALAQLPGPQRDAIELHWFAGFNFDEVAGIVGSSRSAVKVRAHRGYARLRELLGPDLNPPVTVEVDAA